MSYETSVIAILLTLTGLLFTPVSGFCRSAGSGKNVPSWYLDAPDGPGLMATALAEDTDSALVSAVGNLARQLDPNVRTMEEQFEKQMNMKLIRELSSFDFDTVTVDVMMEYYSELVNETSHSGLSQKLVKISFDHGDTTCQYKYYTEEVQGDYSNTLISTPEICETPLLRTALQNAGIRIEKSAQRIVKNYLLVSYHPGRGSGISRPRDTAGDSTSFSPETNSLKARKKQFEREMNDNLNRSRPDQDRSADTERQVDRSDTSAE